MKYRCIGETHLWIRTDNKTIMSGPAKEDIVTKLSEIVLSGMLCYALQEWPGKFFNSKYFVPYAEPEKKEEFKKVTFKELKEVVHHSEN